MKTRSGQKLKLTSVEELLGVPNEESATEIDISYIHSFKNHPFKVLDDEKMADLVESIRVNGVLSPVLLRLDGEDSYEMISGHRRLHASQIVGLEMIPAIVREMTDDEAVVAMVDSNIQREELLPSEKGFAYKMKLEAMRHQGERSDLTLGQNVPKFKRTTEAIAEGTGESYKQVQRYIRLTELIPELLDMVDEKKLGFTIAVDISYLSQEIQKWLYEYIRENGVIKPEQITGLRKYLEHNSVNQLQMIQVLNANLKGRIPTKKVTLSERKLNKYFPSHYSASEMYALLPENSEGIYGWLRNLPQIQGGTTHRNIVIDNESKNTVFETLYKKLTSRNEKMKTGIYNIVFVLKEWGIKSHPLFRYIENASSLETVFVFFEESIENLPLHCKSIVNLIGNDEGTVFEAEDKTEVRTFKYKRVSEERLINAIQILAPVYSEEISLESSLRKSISMFELLGIYSVNDLDIPKRWRDSKICDSMAAPIGLNAKDEIVVLDLHERYHGPHGLVAGTTGSGKSEILQTYILSMATIFHPYEVGFLIIDFKGGGMVNQFKELPHLMGAITNIDGNAIERSLKSIRAELIKRQELFAKIEVNSIEKYINAFKAGVTDTPLPHLIIIVDEFAELKAEQPEFMKELISTARIGRSLGVHLILATQKPAGQVNDQIWSNSRFKLCLKVQTQEDSNEVLKSPLAAEIREPGRAYLQVGNNEIFELLQSGYSGAPEKSEISLQSFRINSLDFAGRRQIIYARKGRKNNDGRTQLDAIVEHIKLSYEKMGDAYLDPICQPELPERIEFNDEFSCEGGQIEIPIGIYDDPDHQIQTKDLIDDIAMALDKTAEAVESTDSQIAAQFGA